MNNIGLNSSYKNQMVEKLNAYLSNVQIAYMNVRGYHWNITGNQFFTLHEKFEEIYNGLNKSADEVAERILTLGGTPLHSYSDYIKISNIKERLKVSSTEATVQALLEDTRQLLALEREILSAASENDDEGTAAMMSELIGGQEKMMWMMGAFLR